jgi:hypothetical protein
LNGERESGSMTLQVQERQKYLLEHIKFRMANTDRMPHIFTFVEAYYDVNIISGTLPEGILISIPLLGFVQTRADTNYEISTMQLRFLASWAPVPGGLSSDQEFTDNVRQSEDPPGTGAQEAGNRSCMVEISQFVWALVWTLRVWDQERYGCGV